MAKVDTSIQTVEEKPISKELSDQINKFVNICKGITLDTEKAREEYSLTMKMAKDQGMGDLEANLLIRKRLQIVIGRDRLKRLFQSFGMKYALDDYKKKDPATKSNDDDEDETKAPESVQVFPVRTIITLNAGVCKEIFVDYLEKKADPDFLIKLVIEAKTDTEDSKLYGGEAIGVKK